MHSPDAPSVSFDPPASAQSFVRWTGKIAVSWSGAETTKRCFFLSSLTPSSYVVSPDGTGHGDHRNGVQTTVDCCCTTNPAPFVCWSLVFHNGYHIFLDYGPMAISVGYKFEEECSLHHLLPSFPPPTHLPLYKTCRSIHPLS